MVSTAYLLAGLEVCVNREKFNELIGVALHPAPTCDEATLYLDHCLYYPIELTQLE